MFIELRLMESVAHTYFQLFSFFILPFFIDFPNNGYYVLETKITAVVVLLEVHSEDSLYTPVCRGLNRRDF